MSGPEQESKQSAFAERFWAVNFPFAPAGSPFFYGWTIVFVATVGMVFSIPGQTMGFSVFTDILMAKLGLSRVALSAAYCVGTVASGLTLPWMGRLLDRWGERKMGVASSLAIGFILFYLSLSVLITDALCSLLVTTWRPSIAFVVIALGFYLARASAQGVLTMTCRNAIGKWFDHRRGIALAISGMLVSFTFSIAPRILDFLVRRFDYAGAWRLMGLTTILVMAPLAWFLFRNAPEESGLKMDGGLQAQTGIENPDMRIKRDYSRGEAIRTYSFWVFNLTFSCYALYGTAITFHVVSIGAEFGLAKGPMLSLFVPMAMVSVGANLLFGWINPRVRLKYLLLVMNLGSILGAVGLLLLDKPGGAAAYVIGNGIGGGGFVSLSGLVWPRFFGRLWLGSISGINMASMVIGSGLGPLFFGWSVEGAGNYKPALIVSILLAILLSALSLRADNPQRAVEP